MSLSFLFTELCLSRDKGLVKLAATMLHLFELQIGLEGLLIQLVGCAQRHGWQELEGPLGTSVRGGA